MKLLIRTNKDHPRLAKKLADIGGLPPPDHVAVCRLCAELTGLHGLTADEIELEAAQLAFPAGFRHIRLFDADDGVEFASQVCRRDTAPEAFDIAVLVTCSDKFETHEWVETSALPARDAGVLDLLIRFVPKEPKPAE